MRRALLAEWTKLRTVRSTAWTPWTAAVLTMALSLPILGTAGPDTTACGAATGCDPVRLSLTGVQLGQLAVIVTAVLTMSAEYGTGLIVPTLTAEPRRLRVLTAKAITVTATALCAGLMSVAGCLIAGHVLLPGADLSSPLVPITWPAMRAASGTLLYLVLIALFSLGLAAALRDTATALSTVLALLYMPGILARFIADERWNTLVDRYAPMSAGLAVQNTDHPSAQSIGPWAGLGVLAAYATAVMAAGAVLFHRRDART
ncbi:ABC transporter permease [Actinomadura spongiicola]|uniref:ABC transporter permease n=1 Tax=Actinomadura spongiicola TaxID=2303421 RepID=A0A372GQY8_9ACTN|nr:ABC transporter permease [Actinomadura spongiicola]RFS87509.1 ABC transporter permease [Actinomadura spongiicola]